MGKTEQNKQDKTKSLEIEGPPFALDNLFSEALEKGGLSQRSGPGRRGLRRSRADATSLKLSSACLSDEGAEEAQRVNKRPAPRRPARECGPAGMGASATLTPNLRSPPCATLPRQSSLAGGGFVDRNPPGHQETAPAFSSSSPWRPDPPSDLPLPPCPVVLS